MRDGGNGYFCCVRIYAVTDTKSTVVAYIDDYGDYRSSAIPAGRYWVYFESPWSSPAPGYASEWYDGSSSRAGADPIWIRGGEITTGVDALLSLAPAPKNDNVANATLVASLPYSDHVDTRNATLETGEPQGCDEMHATVWYRYEPSQSKRITVDTVHPETSYDTTVAIYEGDSGPERQIACETMNVKFDIKKNTPTATRVAFSASPGSTYWIQVGSWGGSGGSLKVSMYAS
jgi:hypothetical protein